MVRLEEHKKETEHKVIEKLPLPARVYIPLIQHLGKICSPLVKAGDSVLTGQKIGSADSGAYAPVHACVSGKVVSIEEWPHPVLGRAKAIVIESDAAAGSQKPEPRNQSQIENLTAEEIRNIVFEAGIVGMGGASFPTHIKLNPPGPVDFLIINGAECEPYLNSDNRLMIEKSEEIIKGMALLEKCTGVKKVYIAIEDNKPEAIKIFKSVIGSRLAVSGRTPHTAHRTPISLKVLKSQYPQGGEKQLIKSILRREVPSGKLPFDIGVIVQNVATVFAVYEAVYLNKPLYERVVTVTGECIANPKNLLVPIGTPIKDLIDFCGIKKAGIARVITGGPMMGIAQYSFDAPVIKSTNGILCLPEQKLKSFQESLCLRCGRCVEYCPLGLMPCMISMAVENEKWDLAKAYGCLECMECGLCSYACPQQRDIVQAVKLAKLRSRK